MWSDRKPWWQRKAKDNNPAENSHYKTWCVIKKAVGYKATQTFGEFIYIYKYIAVGKSNAPQYYDPETGKLTKLVEVDNLTKHEAIACAKGLNFLDGETNGS